MLKNIEDIEKATMQLDLEERASLAGKLLLSLDEPSATEVERLWLYEAERRLEDFRSGKVQSIPAEEVFRRTIAEIS
jgi:putative addiction module component (TIGR02574 family)